MKCPNRERTAWSSTPSGEERGAPAVELLGCAVAVAQLVLVHFSALVVENRNLLPTGMEITPYNKHRRLLLPQRLSSSSTTKERLHRIEREPSLLSHHGSLKLPLPERFSSVLFSEQSPALPFSMCRRCALWFSPSPPVPFRDKADARSRDGQFCSDRRRPPDYKSDSPQKGSRRTEF